MFSKANRLVAFRGVRATVFPGRWFTGRSRKVAPTDPRLTRQTPARVTTLNPPSAKLAHSMPNTTASSPINSDQWQPPVVDHGVNLDEIVRRARGLYSLPAVAMEVLQLTSTETVDTRALKQCVENDPALTARLLRVVNSSLFGLSSQVSDLNQALALLGIKPLKLLVLGFSLPDRLLSRGLPATGSPPTGAIASPAP